MRAPVLRRFFFLMIRRPPRSTLDRSSAASDVYKRQELIRAPPRRRIVEVAIELTELGRKGPPSRLGVAAVSYTHLRAHETVLDLVCRLLLEKKKTLKKKHTHKHTRNTSNS